MSDAVPGSYAAFEGDLAALVASAAGRASSTRMRMRWEALYDVERVLIVPVRGAKSCTKVWLYADTAGPRSRPLFNFLVDADIDLDRVPQGADCLIEGDLHVGRAVRVSVDGMTFLSGTPLLSPTVPAARGPRLGVP